MDHTITEGLLPYVQKAMEGDMEAFGRLYDACYKEVYFTCLSVLKDSQDAADVSQDVWLAVLEKLRSLEDPAKFHAWLNRVTVNKCMDFLKKKQPIPVEDETLEQLLTEEDDLLLPEEYITSREKRRLIMDICRDALSEVQYRTVILYYFNELSIGEIAQIMDCPEGTAGYRLSTARAKIKEGILKYEQAQDEKLHGLILVPFLFRIFDAEAAELDVPNRFSDICSANSKTIAAEKTAEKGVFKMLQSRKAKCIGSALAIGGIAAVVYLSGCGSTSTLPEETTSAIDQQENLDDENAQGDGDAYDGEAVDDGQLAAGDAGDSYDGDSYDGDTADIDDNDEEYDDQYNLDDMASSINYLELASDIAEQTGTFLDAVRAGDLDTIMAMAYPDGDYYEYFEELQNYDCTEEFLRTIYGNLEYTFTDEILEDLADRLRSAFEHEDEAVFVDVAYSVPYMILFKYAYLQSLPAGSEIPKYNYVKYNDDALELLQEIVNNTPCDKAASFWVTLPDEDGNVQVILDDVFDDLKLNRLDRYMNLDEDFPAAFVNEFCLDITASQVGNVTVPFREYDEELTAALPYLEAKDFQGLLDWLDENTDENFREHFESTYGSYDDLTDTQKAYVDDFVDTQISMVFIDEQIDAVDAPYRSGLFMQTYPMIDDYDHRDMPLTDWYRENNVSSIHLFYPGTESPDQLDTFLYGWFEAIEYAREYVE